jgi:ABC-type multidrug transport system fused ATPase/permease subunit
MSAMAAGFALPGMTLVFGDLLDSFICYGQKSQNITLTALNETCDSTYEERLKKCDSDIVTSFEDAMARAAYGFTGVGFGAMIASYLYVSLLLVAAERQTRRMREQFFRSIMRQEIGWFDTNDSGELATRLADDLDKVSQGIGDKVGTFMQWMSTFFGGIIVGFISEWRLALVILAITPVLAVVGGLISKLVTSYTAKEQSAYAKAGSIAEQAISCIRTVVAFGGEDKESERYNVEVDAAKKLGNRKAFMSGIVLLVTMFVVFAAYALGFWYSGVLIREHGASGGSVITTFFAVLIGAFALGHAAPNVETINVARGAALRVFETIDRKSEIDPLSDEGLKPPEDTVQGVIEFNNVNFNYPARPDVHVRLVGDLACGLCSNCKNMPRF